MRGVTYHGISEKGRRERNEDALLMSKMDDMHLFAVADGLGGHAAGDVASRIALTTLEETIRVHRATLVPADLLEKAFENSNSAIIRYNRSERLNAGTTMVAALVEEGGRCTIANVGDSRGYIISAEDIWHTRDHSYVQELVDTGAISSEEAFFHPRKHILTQALGLRDHVSIDIYEKQIAGKTLLLSTDGLHGVVRESRIRAIILSGPPDAVAIALVNEALQAKGTDNITVVVTKWTG